MLKGVNHITIAVSDLNQAIDFYHNKLGMRLKASWVGGAYLTVGGVWICLSVDANKLSQLSDDYSHIAFDIDEIDFLAFTQQLIAQQVDVWKDNKSEGDSLYILDPDSNKLEIHVGGLRSRIAKMQSAISADMIFYDD